MLTQKVEYEWVPSQCKDCHMFGHLDNNCNKKPIVKQVWRVKAQNADQNTEV